MSATSPAWVKPFRWRRDPSCVPAPVRALRVFGTVVMTVVVVAIAATDPRPGLSGDGPWVALGLVTMLAGFAVVLPGRELPLRTYIPALIALGAASCLLGIVQPEGPSVAGMYVLLIMGALRLPRIPALVVCGLAIAAETIVLASVADQPAGAEVAFLSSAVPWFLVMRLVRDIRARQQRAEELVDELRDSRAAHAEAATLAERGRLARDMHDVLAHSLSALALQLEATRLLARERGADPEVVDAVARAHHHAAAGLEEARRAIGALRGDELPGPERLEDLAEVASVPCRFTTSGEPRPLDADVRLALYRAAQEALTNIRKHSAADRVEMRLAYEPDGVALTVQDHGPGAPVSVGATSSGYGLTGMQERAELLGGRLRAEPTDDGFRVQLWLPVAAGRARR